VFKQPQALESAITCILERSFDIGSSGGPTSKTRVGIRTRSYSLYLPVQGAPRLSARTGFTSYSVANFRMATRDLHSRLTLYRELCGPASRLCRSCAA
jgi:hypothetical protein